MKHSDQQNTTQSIVSYNCNKVVDGRNKWSGCYRRVDIDLLEEQRNQCTHRTRNTIATIRDRPIQPDTAYANVQVFPLKSAI